MGGNCQVSIGRSYLVEKIRQQKSFPYFFVLLVLSSTYLKTNREEKDTTKKFVIFLPHLLLCSSPIQKHNTKLIENGNTIIFL
mmetsp:Transcript_25949/g.29690  ORF Transcript_25949/g.29690 Transcript_25949/m.29690 type:complete len:83 (+) Transcript_25949:453-701(+)